MKYNDDAIYLPTGQHVTILREIALADPEMGAVVMFQQDSGDVALAFAHTVMAVVADTVPVDTTLSTKEIVHSVIEVDGDVGPITRAAIDEYAEEQAKRSAREATISTARERETARQGNMHSPIKVGDKVTVGKGKQVWDVAENHRGLLHLTRTGPGRTKLRANDHNVTKAV